MSSSAFCQKRLAQEIFKLHQEIIPGMKIVEEDLPHKIVTHIKCADDSVYEGATYILELKFKSNYPYAAPIVQFIGQSLPCHPHVYSNGHICLSILDCDWTPAMSIWSVCLSIVSMLNSCKTKTFPPDNDIYVQTAPRDPSRTMWAFHDDTV